MKKAMAFAFWVYCEATLCPIAAVAGSIGKIATASMGHGCDIRLRVPQRAVVSSSSENRGSGSVTVENARNLKTRLYIEPFRLVFTCLEAGDGTVDRGWAVFDEGLGQWQTNFDPDEIPELKRSARLYQLQATNSAGWAIAVRDVTGTEEGRRRVLHYCLVRSPKALCGEGEMGYVNDHGPKADLTPYALEILRSIEFLDKPAAAPATESASAAPFPSR